MEKGEKDMKSRKGFTLIELMVVVLIVAVLAAILVPLLTARLEAARWAEGRAALGTIATAVRAYGAEHQESTVALPALVVRTAPGNGYMLATDLEGKYFDADCYTFAAAPTIDAGTGLLTYTIQCNAANSKRPTLFTDVVIRTLNQAGIFNPD